MDEDWEFSDYNCPKCKETLRRRDCSYCGGEGLTDDLFFEDPLWYDPETYYDCDHCGGEGYFIWCANDNCDVTKNEIREALKQYNEREN